MANTTGKKFGGRSLGTPNRSTAQIKNLIQGFVSANLETLQSDFDQLEPKDRLIFMERILKFVVPAKFQEVSQFEQMSEEDIDRIINELRNQNYNSNG
jgi:hypothetical protein